MKRAALLLLLLAVTRLAAAPAVPAAKPFQPPRNGTNVLRVWGNPAMAPLLTAWSAGFTRLHPEWRVETRLTATGLVMPGLYTGAADIALFGRDTNVTDNDGFNHVRNRDPLRIELATGGLDTPGRSCALAVFVHRDNPLEQVTLAQLDAIFGDERRRGQAAIGNWGGLGLDRVWRDRPIALYGYDPRSGPGVFFRHVALKDSQMMHWENFTEFADRKNADGTPVRAGAQAVAALSRDPAGMAVATPAEATSAVKMLAVATDEDGPYLRPTRETLVMRRYAFSRPVFACVDAAPGAPLDPKVRDFLQFALSAEGQRLVESAGGYLPLAPEMAGREAARLR